MIPNIYIVNNELTSPQFGKAFAAGCGGEISTDYKPGGAWAGFGSPRIWDGLVDTIKSDNDFYYGDHAYFGRGKYYRVTKNRFQHNGVGEPDFDRLKLFYKFAKPWNKNGEHIIVCPQSGSHHERFGERKWLDRVLETLAICTDRKIIVRDRKGQERGPLRRDLIGAHCLITHTSNSALEAILAGVPAITTGDCASSIMSLSDPINIERPYYPEGRMEWAATLAANQWTLDEIKNGKCWEKINNA